MKGHDVGTLAVSAILAAVTVLALAPAAGEALSQSEVRVAIDVDVAGNGDRTAGAVDGCASIDPGSELEIDIVLPDPGIPAGVGIKAWQLDLLYDPAVVTVTGEKTDFLLTASGGSDLFTGLSDTLPDSDGNFLSAAFDNTEKYQAEPEGAQEIGPGVIVRIILSAAAEGSTDLTLAGVILVDAQNNAIPIGSLQGASVAVGRPCQAPPPPTVPPPPTSDTPLPDTGDRTPAPQPDGDQHADSTPAAGDSGEGPPTPATPGPSDEQETPVIGGTPVSSDGNGDGGPQSPAEGDGSGGLSAGAWAGIGVGIAAAVAAASAAAWLALRRRTEGPE